MPIENSSNPFNNPVLSNSTSTQATNASNVFINDNIIVNKVIQIAHRLCNLVSQDLLFNQESINFINYMAHNFSLLEEHILQGQAHVARNYYRPNPRDLRAIDFIDSDLEKLVNLNPIIQIFNETPEIFTNKRFLPDTFKQFIPFISTANELIKLVNSNEYQAHLFESTTVLAELTDLSARECLIFSNSLGQFNLAFNTPIEAQHALGFCGHVLILRGKKAQIEKQDPLQFSRNPKPTGPLEPLTSPFINTDVPTVLTFNTCINEEGERIVFSNRKILDKLRVYLDLSYFVERSITNRNTRKLECEEVIFGPWLIYTNPYDPAQQFITNLTQAFTIYESDEAAYASVSPVVERYNNIYLNQNHPIFANLANKPTNLFLDSFLLKLENNLLQYGLFFHQGIGQIVRFFSAKKLPYFLITSEHPFYIENIVRKEIVDKLASLKQRAVEKKTPQTSFFIGGQTTRQLKTPTEIKAFMSKRPEQLFHPVPLSTEELYNEEIVQNITSFTGRYLNFFASNGADKIKEYFKPQISVTTDSCINNGNKEGISSALDTHEMQDQSLEQLRRPTL